ncbi:uncharacterized protein [Hoplias malabaricus]|uniref:uncharacterized protein n=1 Tax=Hoplias malabaricus TaxID=27720 RepID=UPI003462168F
MAEDSQPISTKPQFCWEATCLPSSYGWQPSLLFNQHFGLPPLLDSRDFSWMENLFRKLGSSSWSGYSRGSRSVSLKVHRELSEGVSEVFSDECKWKVSLDVNHFAPSELMLRTQSGFLVVEGKHEERQDEHGYISRHFVRKYKLPLAVAAETIYSCVSGDGILTVEAKFTSIPLPADISIPVQVDAPTLEDKQEDGLQQEETTEGEGIPLSETDASHSLVSPGGPEEKPEEESVAQQTDSDDRLHPTAPTLGGGEVQGDAAEGQQEETSDQQTEMMQEVEEVKKEDISEEKIEKAEEAQEEGQESTGQGAETPDTVMTQVEEQAETVPDGDAQEQVAEGEGQLAEGEPEQPNMVQTQEEIPSQLDIQAQVILEEKIQTKM